MELLEIKNNNKDFQDLVNNTIQDFSNCSLCNLCCIDGTLYLDEPDLIKISRYLRINPKDLVKKYTKYNLKTGVIKIDMPCSFLKNNRCIIYPVRPEVCRNYPAFAEKNNIVYLYGIDTCAVATIFFDLYADFLKKKYPKYYKILEKNLKKEPSVKNGDMRNTQFSQEHIELFIKYLNRPKKGKVREK